MVGLVVSDVKSKMFTDPTKPPSTAPGTGQEWYWEPWGRSNFGTWKIRTSPSSSVGGLLDMNHDGIDDRLQKRRRRPWWKRALWLPWKKYA